MVHCLSAYATRVCVRSEANSSPRLCPCLQVLHDKIRKGGPHGDAEGQPRDQPRNALAVQLPLLCSRARAGAPFKDTPVYTLLSDLARSRNIVAEGLLRVCVEEVKVM